MNEDFALLIRVAEKAIEPFHPTADPTKTLGQWRNELSHLLLEVVEYVRENRKYHADEQTMREDK